GGLPRRCVQRSQPSASHALSCEQARAERRDRFATPSSPPVQRGGKRDMTFKLTRRATLIGLSVCAALPAHAQTLPQDKAGPDVHQGGGLRADGHFYVRPKN